MNVRALLFCSFITVSGVVFSPSAKMSNVEKAQKQAKIEAVRKGDFTFTIMEGTTPLQGVEVTIQQIRHHFGFGAAIAKKPFDSTEIADQYAAAFKKYFEWGTPENEMKWPDVQYEEGADNYGNGDFLVEWCQQNDIKIRGHNLFWNQSLQWVPEWMSTIAYEMDYAKGQLVVDERINGAMTRYKGKCEHWDIINEIIHGQVVVDTLATEPPTMGTLKALTGREDADIFKHILDSAAAIDPETKFCINDYNLLSQYSDKDAYISIVNSLISSGCKVDIIGCECHMGTYMEANDFETKLNDIASRIPGKEIWLTELDFEVAPAQRAQKFEELMTIAYAHDRVGGVVLWSFWEGKRWRDALTSFLVDSTFNETDLGTKWLELIAGWTTPEQNVTLEASGAHSFNGYYGKYMISFTKDDVVYEAFADYTPDGESEFTFQVDQIVPVNAVKPMAFRNRTVVIGNGAVTFVGPQSDREQLLLSVYSLSGKLLMSIPLTFVSGISAVRTIPIGCHVYQIHSRTKTYHTAKALSIH